MYVKPDGLPDRVWALCGSVAAICGIPAYVLLIATDLPVPVTALLATVFAVGFALAGIGLHLGVTGAVSPRTSLLAAIANTAAAVELLAMALVQIAVTSVAPHPGRTMGAIWLGLDVAWDVFGGAGTVLFGFALWRHSRFGRIPGFTGMLVGVGLLALNIGTFPMPPANAGWFDIGPFVALWYLLVMVRVLWLAWPRERRQRALVGAEREETLTGAGAER